MVWEKKKKKMKKGKVRCLKNPVAFVFVVLTVYFALITFISVLRLPESPEGSIRHNKKMMKISRDVRIGKFGEMVIEMLPEDLAFTVFLPSQKAFERDLGLHLNDSTFVGEKVNNDTYAVLTRVLGFTAVPRTIYSEKVPFIKEIDYDSLTGYILHISRDVDGMLLVNRVRSERVDLQENNLLLHVMDGVIMDADFQQSLLPDYDID